MTTTHKQIASGHRLLGLVDPTEAAGKDANRLTPFQRAAYSALAGGASPSHQASPAHFPGTTPERLQVEPQAHRSPSLDAGVSHEGLQASDTPSVWMDAMAAWGSLDITLYTMGQERKDVTNG